MITINNLALLDKEFLKRLDEYRDKKIMVKIISLNWNEEPIAEISGNITSGNINIDGSSAVRRTCSITLITNQMQIDNIHWSLRTKFTVEIGVKNEIDTKYEDIIWFPQGLFIITSFSSTVNSQGCTISIQGKDKMCLLNGDVSGALFAAHEFAHIDTIHTDGSVSKDLIPIYTIIKEAIHTYAQEPYGNIIINDLDTCGVELLDYIGNDVPMYIYSIVENNNVEVSQILFGTSSANALVVAFDQACQSQGITSDLEPIIIHGRQYILHKRIDPSDVNKTAGYRATDITYTGDLTIETGGTITQLLDKLVQMLGEFEYFYDLSGRFIFQRKRIYYNSTWTNAVVQDNETYYDNMSTATNTSYDFSSGLLIDSYSNKPDISKIKNDFAIWGSLTGVENKALPIHLRYAIDRKPQIYYSLLDRQTYYADTYKVPLYKNGAPVVDRSGNQIYFQGGYDWRELIYQMARDNLSARTKINGLTLALATQNTNNKMYWYRFTKSLYTSLGSSWWNQIYRYDDIKNQFVRLESEEEFDNCVANKNYIYGPNIGFAQRYLTPTLLEALNNALGYDYEIAQTYSIFDQTCPFTRNLALEQSLYQQYTKASSIEEMQDELDAWDNTFNTGYDAYYTDMLEFWPHLYRTKPTVKTVYNDDGTVNVNEEGVLQEYSDELTSAEFAAWSNNGFWNPKYISKRNGKIYFNEPESMFFWIDFCDQDGTNPELYQYAVDVIGRRAYSINDQEVKGIYFRATPSLLFVSTEYEPVIGAEKLNYARINLVSPVIDYFKISSQGKSAKEQLDMMLYESTYFQDSITISSIPVYYLEPNTRISVNDDASDIHGEYLIKSFSIQLSHDGLMSITATKAVDRII